MLQTINKRRFFLAWITANLLGFIIGSLLGATSNGFIPSRVSGWIGTILGDLIFGTSIGMAQWIVLHNRFGAQISSLWIAVTAIGFTIGARLGSLLTYRIAGEFAQSSVPIIAAVVSGITSLNFLGWFNGLIFQSQKDGTETSEPSHIVT